MSTPIDQSRSDAALGAGLTEAELRAVAAAAEPDAFISYSRVDGGVAEALGEGLRAGRKEVWIDREKIPHAADWRARARAGIDAAKAVIFVLTARWLASEACLYELEHAVHAHKRLIPVRADPDLTADQLPTALRDTVWIDCDAANVGPAVLGLLAALDDDLAWRDARPVTGSGARVGGQRPRSQSHSARQ